MIFKTHIHFNLRFLVVVLVINTIILKNDCQEQYYFKNYGVQDGLGSSKVYTVIQDKDDILWLGTETGLSRFNGKEFKNFTAKDSLADNGVFSLFEDKTGAIWLGHLNGGLTIYKNGTFQIVTFDSLNITSDITSFQQFQEDTLWITTQKNSAVKVKLNYKTGTFTIIKHYSGLDGLGAQIFGSYVDKNKNFYCITDGGIRKYMPELDSFEIFHPKGLSKYFLTTVMMQDSKGDFWFGTHHGGLYRYFVEKDTTHFYDYIRQGHAGNWITSITENHYGDIWVGTWGRGISRFTENGTTIFNEENGLKATKIQDILIDNENNVLVASHRLGLNVYSGDFLVSVPIKIFDFASKIVNAVSKDFDGNYWFATDEGLLVYSQELSESIKLFNREQNAIDNSIKFIKTDKYGNTWFVTANEADKYRVFKYDYRQKRIIDDPTLNRYFTRANAPLITAFDCDGENLWIGTNEVLIKWNILEGSYEGYTKTHGLPSIDITAIYIDSDKTIWAATQSPHSICKYQKVSNNFKALNLNQQFITNCFTSDKDGVLWVGTTEGVFAIDNEAILLTLDENSGLLNNVVSAITTDNYNRIYIGSSNGLSTYYPRTDKIYNYSKGSAFTGIEIKKTAFFNDENGNIWCGTGNGVTKIIPDNFEIIDHDPVVHIRTTMLEGEIFNHTENLKTKHSKNDLFIEYYIVSLKNPSEVLYQHMLEGHDEHWSIPTPETVKEYNQLPPGKYRFKIRARNSDGVWGSVTTLSVVTIREQFYKTRGFVFGSATLLILGFILYIRIRTQNLIRDKQKLEKTVAERTAEVVKKSEEIEMKNKDIMASIRYAERIQKALLPDEKLDVERFVMYRPKEHVSGDFYWMHNDGERNYIAAVDCTGHGVPGAFMSIIGHDSLNKIIKEHQTKQASFILDELNNEVYKSLIHNQTEDIKDGMDLAFVVYYPSKKMLEFAGAHNGLIRIRKGELEEFKADRFAIGMTSKVSGNKFTNHTIDVEKGDVFYMFSDGYADQFGGPEGKKFKKANLKRELLAICNDSLERQKEYLENNFDNWIGDEEQIDDVLVIGFRV